MIAPPIMRLPPLETVACDLCGSRRHRTVYEIPDAAFHPDQWFNVVECLDCGLGFVNPRPTRAEMDHYYPAEFYLEFETEAVHHNQRYARELGIVRRHARTQQGRLLDVGCANGGFPRFAAASGWQVEGVEVGGNAQIITDFPVYQCELPQIPVGEPAYDAITAWAVIEHVHTPLSYFQKAGELLKPDGVFIFHVTNFDSASSRHLFREDVPRHLYFFNRATVAGYLQRSGLLLEAAIDDDSIYEMRPVNWLQHHIRRVFGLPPLRWQDLPPQRSRFVERWGCIAGNGAYLARHPFAAIDRLLMPLYEKWQMKQETYGMTTYIARKPRAR